MKSLFVTSLILLLAAVGPNIFPAAQAGYSSMPILATRLLIPSIAALAVALFVVRRRYPEVTRAALVGVAAGALATLALEAVRLTGFHFEYMPGNLPRLMGVLLLDQFAQGPSVASDVVGWAYHFWNGAAFGIIYTVLLGTRRRWAGVLYGAAIGLGFMLSPVVSSLGVGFLGLDFSVGFPITVTAAHVAYGWALAAFARRFGGPNPSLVAYAVARVLCPSCYPEARMMTVR